MDIQKSRNELPLSEPDSQSPDPHLTSYPTATAAAQLRILAVDDEPPLLNLLYRVLSKAGHSVDTAANGMIALQTLDSQTYDLIICDVLLPDILGPNLYQKAVGQFPHLRNNFIFVTGNAFDAEVRDFLEKSGLPWLSKPFLPAEIKEIVDQTAARIKTAV